MFATKFFLANKVPGSFFQLLHTLDNPNPFGTSTEDNFGASVAINGDYAIVGAYYEDDSDGNNSGKAYIFNVNTGVLVYALDNPNAYGTSAYDWFGVSVSIDGNYAIVGARQEDDSAGNSSGKAYIFDVSTGALVHTLNNPNDYGTSAQDLFGISVAISGNYAIVGSYEYDSGFSSGKVYVFDVSTGLLVDRLRNPNAYGTRTADTFGRSAAISGNYAIVGAPQEDDSGGTQSGKAYIFDVSTGTLLHTLDNPNAFGTSEGDYFAKSVAIDGNYAIVGADLEDYPAGTSSGKAYIFDVSTGVLLHTLDNPNVQGISNLDYFGYSVGISGNYAIVGARGENNGGKAYIFDARTGQLLTTLDNPNAFVGTSANDQFGVSVAINGDYAIVGAYYEDDSDGNYSGKAYIYKLMPPS